MGQKARLRVALVEAYYGGSHRAWADGYAAHSRHEVTVLGMPATFWKWRLLGGYVTQAEQIRAAARQQGGFDVLLTTSMTNLAGLRGLAGGPLHGVPAVLFMHENQLTYPLSPLDREDLTYAMINWTAMCGADRVWFNSRYHHDAWFSALPTFLGRFPDERHTHLVDEVAARCRVMPLGVDLASIDGATERRLRPVVLWNQRWEYDKGPADFAAAVDAVAEADIEFDVVLAGERYGEDPPRVCRSPRPLR